jgi:hypothetical protein
MPYHTLPEAGQTVVHLFHGGRVHLVQSEIVMRAP